MAEETEHINETPELEEAPLEEAVEVDDYVDTQGDQAREIVFRPRQRTKIRLNWIIDDYTGITESVYEAIMIASHRAHQLGRMQKSEVDEWTSAVEALESEGPVEDAFEVGLDQFNHSKPTIIALNELKNNNIEYSYLENAE